MENRHILDCRGLACPQPVIQTRDALAGLQPGESLLVLVDNEAADSNIRRFAASQQHQVESKKVGGEYQLRLRRGEEAAAGPEPEINCEPARGNQAARGSVVYIGSEVMGRGDDDLGRQLMAVYLDTLSHFAPEVSHLILVNGGVRLAVEGSPVLEQLQNLSQTGVEVLACGACLNHFELTDRLRAGSISNMYTILEILTRAARVLQP